MGDSNMCLRRELHEQDEEAMVVRGELTEWRCTATEARGTQIEIAALRQKMQELELTNSGLRRRAKRKAMRLEALSSEHQAFHDSHKRSMRQATHNILNAVAS